MTADTIAAPRSARNKGSNWEKWGWLYMRVSGVLLVVLIGGHLISNLIVPEGGIHAINWGFVAGKLADPFWQVWDILLLWLAFIHGANGMRTIVNDYVQRQKLRTALVAAIWIASGLLIILGTLVVFAFDPCAAPNEGGQIWEACVEAGLL